MHKLTVYLHDADYRAIKRWIGNGNTTVPITVRCLALTNPLLEQIRAEENAAEPEGRVDD